MKKSESVNTFNKGLLMDLSPLVTPNDSLVNCLNGTILTYNGNENVLQNDMGNGRVGTAYLPQGYIPVGTAQLGGIMYIVSYNPIIKKSQIGCFPSPERNITSDNLSVPQNTLELSDLFQDNHIKSKFKKLILLNEPLHPGDKFQIGCEELNGEDNFISAQEPNNTDPDKYPKYLKLNVVAIQDNGIINNLNNSLIWHDNNYYILDSDLNKQGGKLNLQEYRNLIKSNYNVFDSKVDGKLAILAELECIDTFSVSWDAIKSGDNWNFYFYLNWTYNNQTSQDKINLYGIGVQINDDELQEAIITNYPKSSYGTNNDILKNKDTTFYTPFYVSEVSPDIDYKTNGRITTPRKNDGTDNQFLLTTPFQPQQNSGEVHFDIYPMMPFGYLDWLKQSFSINIDNLGSGKIDLKEYRYYYNEGSVTLNWGLEAYPEINKEIKSVQFEFYEYDEQTKAYIRDNSKNIQNEYSINGTWKSETQDSFSLSTDKVYKVQNRSSYSGHFQESLQLLDNDRLYLVRMVINYNDEKTICYYRLMYTCDIFNQYYFDYNDYKQISLQETIEGTIQCEAASKTVSNIIVKDECTTSAGNIVNTFSEYLDKQQSIDYLIKRYYECNINFDIHGKTTFSGLKVSLDNIDKDSIKIKDTFSPPKPSKTSISADQSQHSTSDIADISRETSHKVSLTGNHYSDKFTQTLKIPIKIDYNNLTSINVPYKFEPLDITCGWLLIDGGSKWIAIYLAGSYADANEAGSSKTEFGDDSTNNGTIAKYANTYNEIKAKLQTCDILALRFRVYHTAKTGSQGNYTIWGYGDYHGGDRPKYKYSQYYVTNQEDSVNLILYLFLDSNGEVRLTTFGTRRAGIWHGEASVMSTDSDSRWHSSIYPLTFRQGVSDSTLKVPFEQYYKVVESSTSIPKYKWSRIHYYENFTWTNLMEIPIKANLKLQVNDSVDIEPTKDIPNLYYQTEGQQFTLKTSVSNSENFDNWIDRILHTTGEGFLVSLPDGDVKSIEVSPRLLYDKFGNKLEYLKQDFGSGIINEMKNSRHKLQCVDGKLQLKLGNTMSTNMINILGRSEEQSIAISNIIQINE